jgi:hypothetical protein
MLPQSTRIKIRGDASDSQESSGIFFRECGDNSELSPALSFAKVGEFDGWLGNFTAASIRPQSLNNSGLNM